MIPDEAVEAAARVSYDQSRPAVAWEDMMPWWRDAYMGNLRLALEAVAPHMMAVAWEEGATAGWKQTGEGWNAEYPDESTGKCSVDVTGNPYRG